MNNLGTELIKGNNILLIDSVLDIYGPEDFKVTEVHENTRNKTSNGHVAETLEKNISNFKKSTDVPNDLKPHLILDLDETLVCVTSDRLDYKVRQSSQFVLQNVYLMNSHVEVLIPSKIASFVKSLAARFQLWVFSMGDPAYVEKILEYIDPSNLIPGGRRFARRSISEIKKDLALMKGDFAKGNFVILDDNVNSWTNLDQLRPFILNSKCLSSSELLENMERVPMYFFSDIERHPESYIDKRQAEYFCVQKDDLDCHFDTLQESLVRIADVYMRRTFECGGMQPFCSLAHILAETRGEVLNGTDVFILSYTPSIVNCSKLVAKILGAQIFEIPSETCVFFVDGKDELAAKDAGRNKHVKTFYDIRFLFDCYFYCKKMDYNSFIWNGPAYQNE